MIATLSRRLSSSHRARVGGLAFVAGLVILTAAAAWLALSRPWLADNQPRTPSLGVSEAVLAEFELETGIRVARVSLTASGGLVDLRYQVVDPGKAGELLHDTTNPTSLVDEATGAVISFPYMQHSHATDLVPGLTYAEILTNLNGSLRPGSRVTVLFGKAGLEHVRVQ